MPVPGFLSSIADKAQAAINNSSLSQRIPSLTGSTRPSSGASPTPTESGSTHKSHTLEQIQHQLRQFQQNYSTTGPVQKIITAEKGVALDFERLSRDAQAQSKELYTWGQNEESDVKDVSDRLAFLNYITGSLASTLSVRLDAARTPLKELRDNEVALTQKRNVRAGLQNQIERLEHSQERGYEKRLTELKEQLVRAESDDGPAEGEHEILVRKTMKESERLKFQALREYGEKLALLSQAVDAVLTALPSVPPASSRPYTGAEETGSIRASLQYALDHWKPGQTTLSLPAGANLDRSHTRSFGVTHAAELQEINTAEHQRRDSLPVPLSAPVPIQESGSVTKPTSSLQLQKGPFSSPLAVDSTPPSINPVVLNNEPSPIPSRSPPVAVALPGPADNEAKEPSVTPTVAETGVPISGGASGPGPSSGSLRDIRSPTSVSSHPAHSIAQNQVPEAEGGSSNTPPKGYESAEEEKRRLEREERERFLRGETSSAGPSAPAYESAEDEKKRLRRRKES
ncbi:Eisosome component PIL1-domain-containing protein [Multifurca ochricompacta]|uniref:Eisosome component PIL1-domain-containing protein n=1 Tax=Multifurca ochricompacta TaxID=376703 RepID=A0AAD4QRQ9_9AGAM|nr:Eisosome component PIL1-domain-containing protein [Multifurca ochricompacta]